TPPPPPVTRGAMIGDRVWLDADGDGLQGTGEGGIADVTVRLLDGNDTVLAETWTSAAGTYHFGPLSAGFYRVEFVAPEGTFTAQDQGDDTLDSDADPATGRTATFYLHDGEANYTIDAGLTGGAGDAVVTVEATDPAASEAGSDTGTFTFTR